MDFFFSKSENEALCVEFSVHRYYNDPNDVNKPHFLGGVLPTIFRICAPKSKSALDPVSKQFIMTVKLWQHTKESWDEGQENKTKQRKKNLNCGFLLTQSFWGYFGCGNKIRDSFH